MSEPVSNARVEHVLASIRRLISQNDRRDRRDDDPAGGAVSRTAGRSGAEAPSLKGDRLLLTPSLRVTGPDSVRDALQPEDEPSPPAHAHATSAGYAGASADVRTITLDAAAADRTSVLRLDESVRLRDDATEPQAAASGSPSVAVQPTNLDRKPEPDDPAPANDAVDFDAEPVGDTPRPRERRANRTSPDSALEAKIAALEAAIARTEGDWEPDGVAGDAYSGTASPAMDWTHPPRTVQENAPYRLEPAARRDVPKIREVRSAGAVASLTDLVDEDMLREIVADIVRQELRGALGDRITRNVRKLVRREILRALESRDID